jgi:hypothetical protein
VAGRHRTEVRLDHQPAVPPALDHEAVGRVLEVQQRQRARIDAVRRKHRQRGVADELHYSAAGGADGRAGERVVVRHDAGYGGVLEAVNLRGEAGEAREDDEQRNFAEVRHATPPAPVGW